MTTMYEDYEPIDWVMHYTARALLVVGIGGLLWSVSGLLGLT